MKKLLVILLLIKSVTSFAEGIPFSLDGKESIFGEKIVLTNEQKKALLTSRVILLTAAQAPKNRKTVDERTIFIITPNHNDCTCGLTYGMWYHPDSVGLVSLQYNAYDTLFRDDFDSLSTRRAMPSRGLMSCRYNKMEEQNMTSLYIGADGKLRYMGKEITYHVDSVYALFDNIDSNIAKIKSSNKELNVYTTDDMEVYYVNVHMPPIYGNKNEAFVLKWYYALTMLNNNNSRYYYVIM